MDDRIADMSPRNEEGNGDSPITVRTTMKPHVGSRMIAASVALGTAFALIAPSSALAGDATPAAASTGTTYYVSSTHGDDGNAGTDKGHPWKTLDKVNAIATDLKPGDSVLLERGSTFQDQYLHIKDTSGTADAPITIADYGDASAKPVIAANGVKGSRWYQNYRASVGNHQNKGTVSSAILLKDVSYITVKNLEITNDDPDVYDPIDTWKWTDTADSDGTKLDRSADRMDRTGVAGIAENGTTMSHVTLEGLNIHDVDGNIYNKHMANGGIYFMAHYARENKNAADNTWLQNHISRFDHITIKNNIVKDVDRWGIAVGYTAYLNFIDAAWGDGSIDDDLIAKYGQTNVTIENNYVKGAGGDAITLMYCDRPVIQYNVGDSVSKHMNDVDYPHDREHGGRYGGWVAAGIWPWRCKDPIFQYNEMYNNLNSEHGNGDGQAWDADYGDGTLYQYNYSYGNSFASLMICNQYAINTTFRYNISQNDRRGVFDLPSNGPGNHIYNNTVYIGKDSAVLTGRSNSQAKFENNIFINATDTKKTETWNRGNQHGGQTYDNNMYVNYANKPASDSNAVEVADVATVLANAGHAPSAPKANGSVYGRSGSEFDGYKPVDNSPAINAGKVISDMNDYAVTNDFFGNTIKGTPDLGAVESNVLSVSGKVNAYETATVGGSKVVYVPFTAKNPTTVKQLRAGLTVGDGSVANVYRGSTKLTADAAIQARDVLRFEVEGTSNTPIEYTIAQKNAWNWVDEFKTATGVVWNSQKQNGADGDWTDITTFSTEYPMSKYNDYYGAGLTGNLSDLPAVGADRPRRQGLLVDDPDTAGGTAIAWKAPKAGTVKVTLGRDNEPQRRNANASGTVTLALTKNGETLCTADISTAQTKNDDFVNCLKSDKGTVQVNAGDVIRIAATAASGAAAPDLYASPVVTYQDVAPVESQTAQYTASYDAVSAKVGTKATATVKFTKDGAAATPTGVKSYALKTAVDGVAVDAATGAVTYTPGANAYGTTKTATVVVTYSDDTTDEATVTFNVEKSNAQKYNVLYPAVSGGAGVALKRTPKFTLKADSAAASIPAGTKFALGTGAPAGASVNAATGEVTLTSTQAGTITVPVTVTFSDTNESIEATATFTVTAPAALGTSKLETGTADGANVIYVPFTAKTPTTVADLLALVTAEPDSALKAVYRDGTKLEDAAAVKAGDVLRFYADGSTFTADYTVVQKNAWNWVDDFKTDSQGPIWTSQRQVSGKWQTITDFGSDVYPQTYYDKYYGVGVDYQNKNLPTNRSAIHGLIADNPGDSAATAMAWTAPKAGSVKVTLDKVTGAHVEPYIRQSNSNGKDVVLKLLKNDEVICSATMTDSFATATGFNECLASAKGTVKVAVGDVLRFSVDAAAGASKSSIHISPVITYTDADEPSPEPGLSEQYAAAYPASVAAKVGEKATAAVSFTKGGAAADAPAGTTFAVAGDGFTVAADGTVSFTPTDAQAGKTVTATVTVTYSDKSTDTATVTFKVAAKTEPEPKPEPTDPKADLRKEVESASKLDEKDYTADSWKVFAAALDNAKAVLEDKDATEAQISGALTTLKSATAALAKAGDTGKPDDGDKPSAGKPNDKGNGLSKTGASVAVIGVAMLLLAAAGFVTVNVVRRRR
ncbi:right-handed parallel beta-helix repeat-containing protein [Bifidobacterium bifidum]|uniref:Right-handed parallel beta-helix repeat-containing protein n=2 Tax=Bifidobacterium bifidum TaxID=1681 RepID=A0A415C3U5_BIFBI|nr:right-handed parallel beta-helix repeat-containing protein [Bifidobacterium bifidum]RGK14270.1 right-handed parallel beta-helix repeat-containing protein [Bifidobacterium bifidum]RHJ04184.1 right-handed parallel beta-helix repeat-containing protein [Bifidobacterium bifidum]RHJ22640.1 right-handed parallel beta-helix repeat-containing protein [Bifidobacterium bifidum]